MGNLKYVYVLTNSINELTEIYQRKNIIYEYVNSKFELKKIRLKSSYLISIIDMFINRYYNFNKDSILLNSRILKWLYGNNYNHYINYLIENNFIFLYKNYSVGNKSKKYKLTNEAKNINYITTIIKKDIRYENKFNKINLVSNNIPEYIKDKLINTLYKVDIKLNDSMLWINNNIDKINNNKSYMSNLSVCNKIAIKDLYYSFDNYGRFHTNFTTLKKHIRNNFLSINDNNLKEIDIKNSQPFFLYLFMLKKGFNITEFNDFDKDVMNGLIYEKFMLNTAINNRKEIKQSVYTVLFGRNIKNKWDDIFNDLYPNVYKFLVDYKKENKNYKIIAQELQYMESNFMYNEVIPAIYNVIPDANIITIHDAIMVENIHYNEVKNIFTDKLNQYILKHTNNYIIKKESLILN